MMNRYRNEIEDQENQKWNSKYLLFILSSTLLLVIHQFFIRRDIDRHEVFSKCTVIKREGYKGGTLVTIVYEFNGNGYEGRIPAGTLKITVGHQYFIKLMASDPEALVVMDDKPVPPCLWSTEVPYGGWTSIPTCSSY